MICLSLNCIVDDIFLVVWCFAIPFYILVLIVLFRYRKTAFKTSFFKIFLSLGIADVSYSFSVYTMGKAMFWRWYNWFFLSYPHLIGTWSLAWNYQAGFAQLNGLFLLTANRYTAIVYWPRYEEIWSERNTGILIAFQWIMSFVFASPRPFIDVSTLVLCLIIVIGYNADSIFPPFPPEVDIEAQRKRWSYTCNNFSCIYDWIERSGTKDLNLTEMECQVKNSLAKALIETMDLFQDGKLDRSFIIGYYSYASHQYCHTYCSVDGPFRYYLKYMEFQLQYAWAMIHNVKCGKSDESYCRWFGYRWIFNVNFSYFSIPATFVLNFINLTTMRQLFLSYPGTAQHLHFAEIITDCLLNVVMGLHEYLYFPSSFRRWRISCGYYRFIDIFQFMNVVKRFLSFLNQAYLTGLVMERLFALTDPLKYNSISKEDMKKRGRKIVFTVLFSSIVLFFPFFCMYTFDPIIVIYWPTQSSFLKTNLFTIYGLMVGFYTVIGFVPFVMQIVIGIRMNKKYKKFIKKRTNKENEKQMKKQERDKQMLLVGTIGLNLVTGIFTGLSSILISSSFYKLIGFYQQWWRFEIMMINSIFIFLNGNAAVIFHITLVRSYRQAFKQTFLGRIIFRQTAVAAGQQE